MQAAQHRCCRGSSKTYDFIHKRIDQNFEKSRLTRGFGLMLMSRLTNEALTRGSYQEHALRLALSIIGDEGCTCMTEQFVGYGTAAGSHTVDG